MSSIPNVLTNDSVLVL